MLGEQRREPLELRSEIVVRIARAHEREPVLAALPEQLHRQAQRRVVLRVQPQLEHEVTVGRLLVEMQADLPRRLLDLPEPLVDPAREARRERRVAVARRQLRVGRGQPAEERLERRRAADARAVPHLHVRVVQAVARDPVDELRVEPVRGGDLSPRKNSAHTGRQRGAISFSSVCRLSSSVAPQNANQLEPPRASCGCTIPSETVRRASVTSANAAACAVVEREVARRHVGQVDQLGDADPARGERRPGRFELELRGLADLQTALAARAVGGAHERVRGRVVQPDELEGRRIGGLFANVNPPR